MAAGLVSIIVGVARVAGGDPILPVVVGMSLLVAVVALTLGRGRAGKQGTEVRARQQLRLASLGLLLAAVYFAVVRLWAVAALLVFLFVFFNGCVWAVDRHKRGHGY